jgi:hypothetical protein
MSDVPMDFVLTGYVLGVVLFLVFRPTRIKLVDLNSNLLKFD